jgi:hypothetical protein
VKSDAETPMSTNQLLEDLRNPQPSRLLRCWSIASTGLAVIGLIDLTQQLIEWARVIHYIASKYATTREWFFALFPFRLPVSWHNNIVLLSLVLSVVNIGFFRRTRRIFLLTLLQAIVYFLFPHGLTPSIRLQPDPIDDFVIKYSYYAFIVGLSLNGCLIFLFFIIGIIASFVRSDQEYLLYRCGVSLGMFIMYNGIAIFCIGAGVLLAWRWIAVTAIVFGVLIGVNEAYVHFLQPLSGSAE